MPTALPGPEILDAALPDVALHLLAYLRDNPAQQRSTIVSGQMLSPPLDRSLWPQYRRRVQEAWDWLIQHGLIAATDPTQDGFGNSTFVTDLGERVLSEPFGVERMRAERRLDMQLHPRIAERVQRQFIIGEYEFAALAAMREVEIMVRELAGLPDSAIGMALMGEAFKKGGQLYDPELDPGESDGLTALFRGAIGVFKNSRSHRQVELDDPTEASEVILFADLLLRMLSRIEGRLSAGT